MATVTEIETRKFDIEINENDALRALAEELKVYEYFARNYGQYYEVEGDKIYSYCDVSYHGSSDYEKSIACSNPMTTKNYQLIEELARMNNINLLH
jgi:hypothetical protein